MTKYPPLMFLGNESLSTCPDYKQTPVLDGLIAAGWPIVAIVIKHRPAISRKQVEPPVIQTAKKAGIDLVVVKDKGQLEETVDRCQPQLGLLASFGMIISQEVLDRFPLGVINVHPSLLPAYRGTTPIESAITDGQTETGVSLIKTIAAMDAGPIYAQQAISIDEQISKLELTTILGQTAAKLVAAELPQIARGQTKTKTQDESRASYTRPLKAEDRVIDWSQPARKIERLIRARAGWPGSVIRLNNQMVRLMEAVLVDEETIGQPGQFGFDSKLRKITVDCQPGRIGLGSVQVPSKRPISAEDFYNSYDLEAG